MLPVALRDCPALSGTALSATLKTPSRTVVEFVPLLCVTAKVVPLPGWLFHTLNQLESASSNVTSTSGETVREGGVSETGAAVSVT